MLRLVGVSCPLSRYEVFIYPQQPSFEDKDAAVRLCEPFWRT